MDRGRYTYVRRQGCSGHGGHGGHGGHNNHHNNHSNSSMSSSSSSSNATSNNNHNYDNHHHTISHRNTNNQQTITSTTGYYNNSTSVPSSVSVSLYATHISNNNHNHNNNNSSTFRESLTPHDELIRYIKEAWAKVSEQGTPVVSCNDSDSQLKNFKPFNLEEYWGQRLVQNIQISSHGHQ